MKDWGLSQLSVSWIALIETWRCFRMISTSGHMHPLTSVSLITLQDIKNKDSLWNIFEPQIRKWQQLSIYYYQWVKNRISKCPSWKTPLSAGLVVIWFNQYSFDFLAIWEQQWSINVFGRALCATCNISSLFSSVFVLHRLVRVIWSFSAAKCYAVFASCTAVLCWKPKPDAERSLSRGMCKVVIFEMYKKKKKTGKQNRKWLFTVHNIIQVSGGPRIPNWSEKMLFTPFFLRLKSSL